MGLVQDSLTSLLRKQIDEYGIVVWYDPGEAYRDFVDDLALPETLKVTWKSAVG